MKIRMRLVYTQAKLALANDNFGPLLDLLVDVGALESTVEGSGNRQYNSHQFFSEALEAVATAVKSISLGRAQASSHWGIVADESMDSALISQLSTYYRFIESKHTNCYCCDCVPVLVVVASLILLWLVWEV